MSGSLSGMRKDYARFNLTEKNAEANPFDQFSKWFIDVANEYEGEANAMVLSTVGSNHAPSSRFVLLKEFSSQGFVFFTHYNSRKGREIENNPHVSLLFYWPRHERQVRIEGTAEKISAEASDEYFSSRPEESRISASISPQSSVVPDRAFLEKKYKEAEKHFKGNIPRPEGWGGYRVVPVYFEFWQGRQGRLHDRLAYKQINNDWERMRLAP